MPPPPQPHQHRNAQNQPTSQQHLAQRPLPRARIVNRQIRGPEQLPQIAAIRNQRVPDACAQGQTFSRHHRAATLLHQEGHDAHRRRQEKERQLLEEEGNGKRETGNVRRVADCGLPLLRSTVEGGRVGGLRIRHSAFGIRHSPQGPVIQQQHHERPRHQHRLAHQTQGEAAQG